MSKVITDNSKVNADLLAENDELRRELAATKMALRNEIKRKADESSIYFSTFPMEQLINTLIQECAAMQAGERPTPIETEGKS